MPLLKHLFDAEIATKNARYKRIFAAYELALTIFGFLASLLFLIGSILFFHEEYQTQSAWCFVIGSTFFLAGPTTRLVREIHYARIGNIDDLATRAKS